MALRHLTTALWARLRKLSQRPWLAALVIVAVLMTPGFYRIEQIIGNLEQILVEVRKTQQEGSPTLVAIAEQQDDIEAAVESAETAAKSSTQLLDLILDCFDPESECAKESAAHEAEQAGADLAANVATAFCQDQVLPTTYTYEELFACVGRRLDEHRGDQR